jgi:hypothetical protein
MTKLVVRLQVVRFAFENKAEVADRAVGVTRGSQRSGEVET